MRILLIHADRFSFRVTGETSVALPAELEKAGSEGQTGEALVVFLAAEKGDDKDVGSVAGQAVGEILNLASQVQTHTVVVYPYAHLSSTLSSPRVAVRVLDAVCDGLKARDDLKVIRAPFGYYKAFEISCKGHPLSELAKTITPSKEAPDKADTAESQALKAEKTLKGHEVSVPVRKIGQSDFGSTAASY